MLCWEYGLTLFFLAAAGGGDDSSREPARLQGRTLSSPAPSARMSNMIATWRLPELVRTSDTTAIAFQKQQQQKKNPSFASSSFSGRGAFFAIRSGVVNLCFVLPQHDRLSNCCSCKKGAKSGSVLDVREENINYPLFILLLFFCFCFYGLKNERQFFMCLKMMSRNSIKTDQRTKSNRTYLSCI